MISWFRHADRCRWYADPAACDCEELLAIITDVAVLTGAALAAWVEVGA